MMLKSDMAPQYYFIILLKKYSWANGWANCFVGQKQHNFSHAYSLLSETYFMVGMYGIAAKYIVLNDFPAPERNDWIGRAHLPVSWYCSRWSIVSARDGLLTSATRVFAFGEGSSFASFNKGAIERQRGGNIGSGGTGSIPKTKLKRKWDHNPEALSLSSHANQPQKSCFELGLETTVCAICDVALWLTWQIIVMIICLQRLLHLWERCEPNLQSQVSVGQKKGNKNG